MAKILFISFVQPFPADDGKKAVLEGLVRYFLAQPDTTVDYLVLGGTDAREPPDPRLTFHRLGHATRPGQLLALLRSFLVLRAPLQQALLYNDPLRRAISQRMKASNATLVIYDTIRVSQFIEDPHAILPDARHVLYLDDLFSVRYATMLQAMDRYPQARLRPLGNFAHHLPKVCQPLVNTRRVCRYLLQREMRLVEEVETAEVGRFDVSVLVNRDEVELLRDRTARSSIVAIPISLARRSPASRRYRGRPDFVFVGALNVPHNQCSIEYFIDSLFEVCLAIMPDMKLRVIGQAPSDRLRSLFARYRRNIEWTAWVADLGDVFAQCAAMVAPLLFGSGVKVKTLEALRYGLPVVSTSFGVEGIVSDQAHAAGIVLENDLRRFPRHMESLLNPETNDRYSRDALGYYAASYGAEAVAAQYRTVFAV